MRKPDISADSMVDFLMNKMTMPESEQNIYRKRCIEGLRETYGDEYADEVYMKCAAIYKQRRKGKRND